MSEKTSIINYNNFIKIGYNNYDSQVIKPNLENNIFDKKGYFILIEKYLIADAMSNCDFSFIRAIRQYQK